MLYKNVSWSWEDGSVFRYLLSNLLTWVPTVRTDSCRFQKMRCGTCACNTLNMVYKVWLAFPSTPLVVDFTTCVCVCVFLPENWTFEFRNIVTMEIRHSPLLKVCRFCLLIVISDFSQYLNPNINLRSSWIFMSMRPPWTFIVTF